MFPNEISKYRVANDIRIVDFTVKGEWIRGVVG
jgi:hypothetical protein